MTEEKKKREDEVPEEELEDVAGGIIEIPEAGPKTGEDENDSGTIPNKNPRIGIIEIPD